MNQLMNQTKLISGNLDELYTINEDLDARMKNLSSDPDTITVYAHELGYISNGEKLIKLAGFSGRIDRNLIPGSAISLDKPDFLPEWICKLFGLASGFLAFFLFSFFYWDTHHGNAKKSR